MLGVFPLRCNMTVVIRVGSHAYEVQAFENGDISRAGSFGLLPSSEQKLTSASDEESRHRPYNLLRKNVQY